jgi:DUF971 family protein
MNNAAQNNNCPPLMSDGRHGTDYRPSCYVHGLINEQNGIVNSHQQRLFLQRNAEKLLQLNLDNFHQHAGCKSCQYYHVDPHGHDQYWSSYRNQLDQNKSLNPS